MMMLSAVTIVLSSSYLDRSRSQIQTRCFRIHFQKGVINMFFDIFTARKRSLRRLCFSACQSFCSQGGRAWRGACAVVGGMCVAGGRAWQGACMAGGHVWQGALWWGACMAGGMQGRAHPCVAGGVHEGACVAGGMHGRACMAGVGVCMGAYMVGACVTGGVHGRGHARWGVHGGVCGRGHAWQGGMHTTRLPHPRHHEIRSVNARRYASNWKAFLFHKYFWFRHMKYCSMKNQWVKGEGG